MVIKLSLALNSPKAPRIILKCQSYNHYVLLYFGFISVFILFPESHPFK